MTNKTSFAKLLSRSKFATYDPSISQSYSAPLANRVRGDFGFKRPIQGPEVIRIKSQDNDLGMVDYQYAHGDSRTLQKLQDMRISFVNRDRSSNYDYSSYSDKLNESTANNYFNRPETELMSEKDFKNYLNHVKSLRKDFRTYLNNQALENSKRQAELKGMNPDDVKTPNVDLYQAAQSDPYVHQSFLKQYHAKQLEANDSKKLISNPHFNGGLKYSLSSQIESNRLAPSIPGRILPSNMKSNRFRREKKPIAVGGMVASTDMSNIHGFDSTDFAVEHNQQSRDGNAGKANFRVVDKAHISKVPRVVNNENTKNLFNGSLIEMELIESSQIDDIRQLPIGSPEYVSTYEKDLQPNNQSISRNSLFKTMGYNLPLFGSKKQSSEQEESSTKKISDLINQVNI